MITTLPQEDAAAGTSVSASENIAKATFASMQTAVALQRQLDVTIQHLYDLTQKG